MRKPLLQPASRSLRRRRFPLGHSGAGPRGRLPWSERSGTIMGRPGKLRKADGPVCARTRSGQSRNALLRLPVSGPPRPHLNIERNTPVGARWRPCRLVGFRFPAFPKEAFRPAVWYCSASSASLPRLSRVFFRYWQATGAGVWCRNCPTLGPRAVDRGRWTGPHGDRCRSSRNGPRHRRTRRSGKTSEHA